ncbi:MAG TPA: AraC family transcriptional regulator [Burkholderiaceae bacterium]|nr:AraC family transcriptional regulator [Burkholderiaceae bacterium]
MVVREFPDFLTRPHRSAEDSQRRDAFFARWQVENVIIGARVRYPRFGPFTHRLSIKAAWNGREHYYVGDRRIAVDDDTYLILNEGRSYASGVHERAPVDTFSVFFRAGLPDEVYEGLTTPVARALEDGTEPFRRCPQFAEHLRPHDTTVTPLVHEILRLVRAGVDDEMLYEQHLVRLLERMVRAERDLRRGADGFEAARSATRAELHRRVMLATDFIHSNYTRPIVLDDIAAAARLSKYYLVRLFSEVHGLAPHGFLLRKRVGAARRLLTGSAMDVNEIAETTGLGSRWSLYRQLRKQLGVNAQGLRGRGGHGQTRASQ